MVEKAKTTPKGKGDKKGISSDPSRVTPRHVDALDESVNWQVEMSPQRLIGGVHTKWVLSS
eukprot:3313968-Amphidinium_carterae.1